MHLPFEAQVVTDTFHSHQFRFRGNQVKRFFYFLHAAEGIARALDEQTWRAQVGQMLAAQLLGFARRVKRVGEQKESGYQIGFGGAEHRCLASTVRMTAEKDSPCDALPQHSHCVAQACAIALGIARKRRTGAPLVPERQITAQDCVTVPSKCFAQGDEQWGIAVRTRAMCEDQSVADGILGRVQETSNRGVEGTVKEWRGL